MRRSGLAFLVGGLLLGVLTTIYLQRFAEEALFALIDGEARSACSACHIERDSFHLSLLTLSGVGHNVRLVSNDKPALTVREIHVSASLRELLHRTIPLDLELIGANAIGVGEDSPTYKFIDYLSAPLPPEHDKPGRWKAKLSTLTLTSSHFSEAIDDQEITGDQVEMTVKRNAEDNFVLLPLIGALRIRTLNSDDPGFFLGNVKSRLVILDTQTSFESVELFHNQSKVSATAISETRKGNALSGEAHYQLDASSFELQEYLRGYLKGSGSIGGRIAYPTLEGQLSLVPESTFDVLQSGIPTLSLDSLEGAIAVNFKRGEPLLVVSKAHGKGEGLEVSQPTPLTIKGGKLSGGFKLDIEQLISEDIQLDHVSVLFNLSGDLSHPKYLIDAHAEQAASSIFAFDNISAHSEFTDLKTIPVSISAGETPTALTSTMTLSKLPTGSFNIREGTVVLRGTHIVDPNLYGFLEYIGLSGTVDFSGPLDLKSIRAKGLTEINFEDPRFPLTLNSAWSLEGGKLSFAASDTAQTVTLDGALPFTGDQLVTLNTKISDYNPPLGDPCMRVSLEGNYASSLTSFGEGNGKILLRRLQVGCAPYTLGVNTPKTFTITRGDLRITDATVQHVGALESITINGSLSVNHGANLKALGKIPLETFLPFTPQLDNLSGSLSTTLSMSGPLEAPLFSGDVTLDDVVVSDESMGLLLSDLKGTVSFQDKKLTTTDIQGRLNSGSFTFAGELPFQDLSTAKGRFIAKDIAIEPEPHLSGTVDAQLQIEPLNSDGILVGGLININEAQFQQNINLRSILQLVTSVLNKSKPTMDQSVPAKPLPVELDIAVQGARNISAATNFFEVDLKADFHIRGNLSQPWLDGSLDAVDGWFGLQRRRFNITSGAVTFTPGTYEPTIEMVAESNLPSSTGENLTVLFEANGPLRSPQINLSSDRGLTQREILQLISGSEQQLNPQEFQTVGIGVGYKDFSLLDRNSPLFLESFLSRLSHIDTISLEPSYNALTGALEPAVVAQKKLTEDFTLIGQGLFGGTSNVSRLGIQYGLGERAQLAGFAESLGAQNPTALGMDVSYTVLESERRLFNVDIYGNRKFSNNQIKSFAKLKPTSPLRISEIPQIGKDIEAAYEKQGFLQAKAGVSCLSGADTCTQLEILLYEGPQSRVTAVTLTGDDVSSIITHDVLDQLSKESYASQEFFEETLQQTRFLLRKEGFIAARLSGEYVPVEDSPDRKLVIDVKAGNPVSFFFSGNSHFSAEQLLSPLNLFGRKQPFGNNSIRILVEDIERLYRGAGFLYATISWREQVDPISKRTNYYVTIREESPVTVSKVRFEGNQRVSTEQILAKLHENYFVLSERLLKPSAVIEEELDLNEDVIKKIFEEEGFPQTQVAFNIVPTLSANQVEILYTIAEGPREEVKQIIIDHLPEGITFDIPNVVRSYKECNDLISELSQKIQQSGYLTPSLSSLFSEPSTLTIQVNPGERILYGPISIRGNSEIAENVIRKQIAFTEGQGWNEDEIRTTKRQLLRLGLFSRVDISAKGDTGGTRPVEIWVTERPLRTLRVGTGANSTYGAHLFGEATDRALFADGKTLSLRSDIFYQPTDKEISLGSASLLFTSPRLWESEFTGVEDLRVQRITKLIQEFDVQRTSLSSYLYRAFDVGFTSNLGHTLSSEDVIDVSPGAILSDLDSGNALLSFINGSTTYDGRDDPLSPTSGFTVSANYKLSSSAIGSDANFYSVGGRGSYLLPFTTRFTLALNSRVDSAWTFGDTSQVPITQRFYLGGRNSLRGFRENSLGPRGFDDAVIGGDILQANTVELQYLIANNTSVHTFMDVGNVFLRDRGGFDFSEERKSVGIGAQYLSPIGPIGIDIGRPLVRRSGEDPFRIHFSVGTNF